MSRPVILILIDYYLPGYKAGGPIRTIANVVEQLGENYDFRILTRNRDLNESEPYPNVESNAWNRCGNSLVYYAASTNLALIYHLMQDLSPDVVYLNSFFSTITIRYLTLRRLGLVRRTPVILAPRGEFSSGALRLESFKKRPFMRFALYVGLYRDLIWQASTLQEKREIQRAWKTDIVIRVAPDVPPRISRISEHSTQYKEAGSAHFVFLSRITPMKNTIAALKLLSQLQGAVSLSIIGPIGDERYWRQCQDVMSTLPNNVKVEYLGAIPHHRVQAMLGKGHFFLLPTMGENFGHAILEAMIAGCPVLISDQTPWHGLADKNAGWDLPLDAENAWLNTLQACVDMGQDEYKGMSASARIFASDWIADSDILQANTELFRLASLKVK